MNDRARAEDYRHHLSHLLNEARARVSENIYFQATFPSYVIGFLESMFEREKKGIAPPRRSQSEDSGGS